MKKQVCNPVIRLWGVLCVLAAAGVGESSYAAILSERVVEEPTTPEKHVVWVSSAEEVAALGVVQAGTEIVWRKGSYADQVVTLKAAGTAENPVVVRAEAPGETLFTGASRLVVKGSGAVVSGLWWKDPTAVKGKAIITLDKGSENCVVEQCAITGQNTELRADIDAKWVSLYGRNHRVERCSFLDKKNMGTLLVVWLEEGVDAPAHRIIKNHFERPVTLYAADGKMINGQETIRIGTSSTSMQQGACTVEGNYFFRCHGEQAEIVSNKSCANLYRGNLFEQSRGALTLRHGNRCRVSGNFFLGGGVDNTGGVRIIGEDHTVENNYMQDLQGSGNKSALTIMRGEKNAALSGYWQVKRAIVRNNIIVNCRNGLNVNYGSTKQTEPVIETRIEQNIVSTIDPKHCLINYVESPRPKIQWSNNYLYGGRFKGIEQPLLNQAPRVPNVAVAVENIRRTAGVAW
ncbi:MAG: polysaccharide lyase 6 family protein [Alistipes sp.]|nr:polysaccharide lyase 6 family protein [Alistipes sp.]